MLTAVRHKISNLLIDYQECPALPASETDTNNRIATAIVYAGGLFADWEIIEIPADLWTGINVKAELTAVYTDEQLTGISQSTPPILSKVDGVGSVTVNLAAGSYNGEVKWCCRYNGAIVNEVGAAVSGADSWEIETFPGTEYVIQAIVPGFGVGEISFEGV